MWKVSAIIFLVALGSAALAEPILPSDSAVLEDMLEQGETSPAERGMPYFILCMILSAFSVAAYRMRQNLWLVTLLSLVASGLLIATMVWHDGTGIEGRATVFYELLPGEAVLLQEQSLRTGVIPPKRVQLPDGLAVIGDVGGLLGSRSDSSFSVVGKLPSDWKVTLLEKNENTLRMQFVTGRTALEEAWYVDQSGLLWQWREDRSDGAVLTFIPAGRDPIGLLEAVFAPASKPLRKFLSQRASEEAQRGRLWALILDAGEIALPLRPEIGWSDRKLIFTTHLTPPP